MNMAAHDRIIVTGKIQFDSIISFSMRQTSGEHATASLRGVLTKEGSLELSKKVAGETVTILDRETGNFPPVFEGLISDVRFSTENGLDIAELQLLAGSILLDLEKKSRSFQNVNLTYDDVITAVLDEFPLGDAILAPEISGKKIGQPIIRYCETAWEFIQRLASHFNLSVFSDIRSNAPRVYVGAPKLSKSATFTNSIYSVGDGKEYFNAGGQESGLSRSVFLRYDVEDGNNYFLGWKASFKGRSFYICGKSCELDNGLLVYKYTLADRSFCYARKRYNPYFAGMTLLGRVLKTEKADVRLHLDIDKTQDVKTAYRWPWAPESGNLMYLMPEVGTRVSLYFGDDEEANGCAIHCVRDNAPTPSTSGNAHTAAASSPPQSAASSAGTGSRGATPAQGAASSQSAAPSEDAKGQDFSPEDRNLTYGSKSLFIEPGSIGITTGTQNVMLDSDGAHVKTAYPIYIMAKADITLYGRNTVALQCHQPIYPYGGMAAPNLVYLCQGSLVVGGDGDPIIPNAIIQVSGDSGGEVVFFAESYTRFNATDPATYDRILDDPEIGYFDTGKFWRNVAIGVVIVVVIGVVTCGVGAAVAASGVAGAAGTIFGVSTACALTTIGVSVVGTGLFYVGSKALSDYQRGVVSDWTEYAMSAVIGCAIGLVNAMAPFIPGVGTSFLATVGAAFGTGMAGNLLDQALTGGDIDWMEAIKAGAFSALLAAVMFGVCFVEGTPVLTANGIVAIEAIAVGDLVWSENHATGEKGLKRVVKTFVKNASELVHVCIGGETVSCTPGHPFYVVAKGWTSAQLLGAGSELRLQSGEVAVVESVENESLAEPIAVYNFQVADWHSYYVGDIGVLVHNLCINEVDYGGNDLSQTAIDYRQANNIYSAKNVAVFEYVEDGVTKTITMTSERGVGHAERLIANELRNRGISPSQVTRIYSELEPCSVAGGYCKRFIADTFPQAKVTYSFPYGDSASRAAGVQALRDAVSKIK